MAAAGYLSEKYGIHHIKIFPYNSQANGVVEHKHFDICKSLMKTCNNEHSKWVCMAPLVFWADRVTVHQPIGYSPYFMAHGVEAVLPLDIVEATYLLPPLDVPTTTEDLIAHHAQQLQKRPEDLREMSARVLKARKQSAAQFVSISHPPSKNMTLRSDHLSLCAIPASKRSLTAKPSLIFWVPWWLSIVLKVVPIFWQS